MLSLRRRCEVRLNVYLRSALRTSLTSHNSSTSLYRDIISRLPGRPSTNTYYYVKAVVNTNPSDLYFYSLPLGTTLPATSSPSCSACTKSLMGLYADAMKDTELDGLKETYTGAAQFANKACGEGYAQKNAKSNGGSRRFGGEILGMLCATAVSLLALWGLS
jgi:hypothetical protein